MSDLVLMKCKECGWVHEAVYPSFDSGMDQKYTHCQNCFADYTEFESLKEALTINTKRYKPGLKILVD